MEVSNKKLLQNYYKKFTLPKLPKMISENLVNIPLQRSELSYKSSKYFEMKSNFQFFSFYCFALNFRSFYILSLRKSLDSFHNVWRCEVWIDKSNNTLDVGFTLTSLNYLSKIVLAKKMVNKINEPCHYEVLCQQSACIKRSCTIFSVMLSNIWVQHLRKYRKWSFLI